MTTLARRGVVDLQHGRGAVAGDPTKAHPGRLRVCDEGIVLDLILEEADGIQAVCTNGEDFRSFKS